MAGDPGMNMLNTLIDDLWLSDLGAAASGVEQDRYESGVIEEARAIAAGEIEKAPTVEHLRVALSWLDGSNPKFEEEEIPF